MKFDLSSKIEDKTSITSWMTLLKLVATTLPSYTMSVFLIFKFSNLILMPWICCLEGFAMHLMRKDEREIYHY